jgi:hypothetical protein
MKDLPKQKKPQQQIGSDVDEAQEIQEETKEVAKEEAMPQKDKKN